jgi:hypothetical protein
LKNNKPAHYDTDFFELALVEAGVVSLAFGPRSARPPNPFRDGTVLAEAVEKEAKPVSSRFVRRDSNAARRVDESRAAEPLPATRSVTASVQRRTEEAPMVPLAAYERLQNELNTATDLLEDTLAEHEGDLS